MREARPAGSADAMWQGWYRYFPWEDWREGKPQLLARIEDRLCGWAQDAASEPERRLRQERLGLAFGLPAGSWNEELVLERYELLYAAGLVAEASRDLGRPARDLGPTATVSAPGLRWRSTTAASSPPPSAGCAARSNTGRSCSN